MILTRLRKRTAQRSLWTRWKRYTRWVQAARTIKIYMGIWATRDPIRLERVRCPLIIVRSAHSLVYDARSLLEYIEVTGDFRDPLARGTYMSPELLRIARRNNLPHRSLVEKRVTKRSAGHARIEVALKREMDGIIWREQSVGGSGVQSFALLQTEFVQAFHNLRMINLPACRVFVASFCNRIENDPDLVEQPVTHHYILNILRRLLEALPPPDA